MLLRVVGDDDDRGRIDDLIEQPVDQDELVERLHERDIDEIDGDPLVAERFVEQDVDPGKLGQNFEDLLQVGIFGETELDRSCRRRLEDRALAEELAGAAPAALESLCLIPQRFAFLESFSGFVEDRLRVAVRRIEIDRELELRDRLFQILGGKTFLCLLHVIGGRFDEGAFEAEPVLDVLGVFVDGAGVVHDRDVPLALLRSCPCLLVCARSGTAAHKAQAGQKTQEKEQCKLGCSSSHDSSVGLKGDALGSARPFGGNGDRFQADLDHGETVRDRVSFGACENLVAVEKNGILRFVSGRFGLLDEAGVFDVHSSVGSRRCRSRDRRRRLDLGSRRCRGSRPRGRSSPHRAVGEQVPALPFVFRDRRQHASQIEIAFHGSRCASAAPPSARVGRRVRWCVRRHTGVPESYCETYHRDRLPTHPHHSL